MHEALEKLSGIVVQESALQERLLATTSRDEFVALVVDMADEHGLAIAAADVEAALQEQRRAHLERWV